jgi:hypothetical protein
MRLLLVIALAGCLHHDATGDGVSCTGQNPTFPAFDKICERADECFVAFHMVSCCGSQVAIGVSNVDRDRFAADEAVCESQYPACGCPPGPTQAEDGNTTIDNNRIVVQCTSARQCATAVLQP